jgi:hypothetical protein
MIANTIGNRRGRLLVAEEAALQRDPDADQGARGNRGNPGGGEAG